MGWRGTLLLVVAAAGLVAALKAPGLVLQGSIVVSSAMLGVFAVLLVRRRATPWPSNPRLAAAAKRAPFDDLEDDVERVELDPWPEEDVDSLGPGDSSISQRLSERLAPPAADSVDWDLHSSDRETLAELLREGEDLRLLGHLLKVNLNAYGDRLSKGLACARAGRFDQCAFVLRLANARLRAQVQSALEGELLTLRTDPSFGHR